MFIWRNALQHRYSSVVNSDIKFEISDFDRDNAPLELTVVYSVITQSW